MRFSKSSPKFWFVAIMWSHWYQKLYHAHFVPTPSKKQRNLACHYKVTVWELTEEKCRHYIYSYKHGCVIRLNKNRFLIAFLALFKVITFFVWMFHSFSRFFYHQLYLFLPHRKEGSEFALSRVLSRAQHQGIGAEGIHATTSQHEHQGKPWT